MNIDNVINYLKSYNNKDIKLMEICGTHTASIAENAIQSIISDKIHLISGPGCPVCVTVSSYVDRLCELALQDDNVIVTFGDMIRVPGRKYALKDIKSQGADIRMVYSPMQALDFARRELDKTFIFAAVGFETTTPIYALLIDRAIRDKISNIKLLTALKTMPAVVDRLCGNGVDIDGFIAPGHVCAVTGAEAFLPLAEKYNIPFAVSGFEAEEILSAIYALVKTIDKGEGLATVMNLYKSVVRQERNEKAFDIVNKYFVPCSASWRGLGKIESSGLILRDEYSRFDAGSADLTADFSKSKGCMCGEIITGKKTPSECPLFKKVCTPETPMGACMVSGEGTCFNLFIND